MDNISSFFCNRRLTVRKALWHMYRWNAGEAWIDIGFPSESKEKSPQVKGVQCMIHQYAQPLACKTLPSFLKNILDYVVKIVSFIEKSVTSSHLFKQLCKELNSDHENLLYYTAVRWLSRGNCF